MSTSFLVTPLPPEDVDRIRSRGTDDFGNELVVTIQEEAGAPLRCCLRDATVGERVALIAWQPAEVGGAYAEIGPVFIHADRCPGYAEVESYPPGFRHRNQLFRAYDEGGRQVENRIVEGSAAETAIADLFASPGIAHLHSRNLLSTAKLWSPLVAK